jgi:hypothetical protein
VSAIIYKTLLLLLPHENEFTDVQRQNCVIKRDGRAGGRASPLCTSRRSFFASNRARSQLFAKDTEQKCV